MKITIYTYMLFLLFTTLIISCDQKKTTKEVSQTLTNSFTANVDGKSYDAVHVSGFISPVSKTLLLTGGMGTGEDIQLFLPKDITAGTYDFKSTIKGKYQQNDELAGFAVSGTIKIIAHDITSKKIKGSFNFITKPILTGNPSFEITEGNFEISY